jgi:uncharacterized protein (TIGR00369 family)
MEKVQIPEHGSCFVCGTRNPHGIGVRWERDEQGTITTEVVFNEAHQGPPGFVHGGASAAVLDEAMGSAVWSMGYRVVAANLEINYLKPVPLGQKVFVEARVAEQDGRKVSASSEIRFADGTVAVNGRGLFIDAPHIFEGLEYDPGK